MTRRRTFMAFRPSKKAIETDASTDPAWREVVDPDLFLAIDDLELVAKGVVEGFMEGRHRSPFVGFSVEFDSHREYQPGDAIPIAALINVFLGKLQ